MTTLRAAIYARKSSAQEKGDDGNSLSVSEQIASATKFIEVKGWHLGPVFKDEITSGWDNYLVTRPEGKRLMDSLSSPHRGFDVLVVRNETRMGRGVVQLPNDLLAIVRAGVQIWYYESSVQVAMETAMDKLMACFSGFGGEFESEKRSKATRAGKRRAATSGLHPGGTTPYGYKVEATAGKGHRLVIHEPHAAVIRRIFALSAEGKGTRDIARRLNAEKIAPPSKDSKEWVRNTVGFILKSTTYIGIRTVNSRGADGKRERVQVSVPELRIIDPYIQAAILKRQDAVRKTWAGHRSPDGTLKGRPEGQTTSAHLLGGLLKCECGSPMVPIFRLSPKGKVRSYYFCERKHKKGSMQCSSRHYLPYDRITTAIVSHFTRLHESVLEQMIDEEWASWQSNVAGRIQAFQALKDDVTRLEGEIQRLTDAVAASGGSQALLAALAAKERQKSDALAKVEYAEGMGEGLSNVELHQTQSRIVTATLLGVTTLKTALETRGESGRLWLRRLIKTPIMIEEMYVNGNWAGWRYTGEAALGALAGIIPGKAKGVNFAQPVSRLVPTLTLAIEGQLVK